MVFVMGITIIDKSNLVVIPTHMIKNILIVHCDLILSSVGKFGCWIIKIISNRACGTVGWFLLQLEGHKPIPCHARVLQIGVEK